MIRATAALALVLTTTAGAWAQLIIRPPAERPQPAGVVLQPSLPFVGAPGAPGVQVVRPALQPIPFLAANPFYYQWGFSPYWPMYYDVPPPLAPPVVRTEVNVVAVPATPPVPPQELKARLTLNVPASAQVWLGGQPVDAAAIPIILESPALESGQRYSFDVRVVWNEGRKEQERKRTVLVEAGDSKSLTYTAANGDGQ